MIQVFVFDFRQISKRRLFENLWANIENSVFENLGCSVSQVFVFDYG